jgi:predicted MFS family arabinose efflux permease
MNILKKSPIARIRWRSLFVGTLPLLVVAHFAHHLLTALPAPMLPMIRSEFALDYTQAGMVVSAFSLAYGIGQLPAGWITDLVGARIVITIGICGIAIAGFFVGLSPTYIVLLVFMALMGLAGGSYHPAAPPVILAAVEPTKLGRALGLHAIGGSASYFIAPIVAAAIASVWGWRGAFIGLAIPATLLGIILYFAMAKISAKRKTADTVTQTQLPVKPGQLRRIIFFIILSTYTQSVSASVLTFVPLFAIERFGVTREAAAVFLSLNYSSGLWAAPLGGYLTDRVGSVPAVLVVCFLAAPAVYLVNLAPEVITFGALMMVMGMISYVRMPASEAFIVSETTPHNRATILGIYYFGNSEASALLTPVAGYLIDRFGFYSTFTIGGATILVVTLLCSIWLWGRRG